MGKNKRKRKISVHGTMEGEKSEKNLLEYLKEHYLDPTLTSFMENPKHGGTPNSLILSALKYIDRDLVFVWLDEDKDLDEETLRAIAKCWNISPQLMDSFLLCALRDLQSTYNIQRRKPVLIVSQPVCVESLILKTLGYAPPCSRYEADKRDEQIKQLKSALGGVFKKNDHREFYRRVLNKQLLEERRKSIPELDLLISMITAHQTAKN